MKPGNSLGQLIMEKRTWGPFTGTHLTVLLTAATLTMVPTALWSVAAFTNVAIQDPGTGARVAIDGARRMFVYDQVGDWDQTPANFVRVFGPGFGANNCSHIYTVPAGKALIIKSMHAYINRVSTSFSGEIDYYDSATCLNTGFIGAGSNAQDTTVVSGVAIPSGHVVSQRGFNTNGASFMYGYLVPAGWVPASAPTSVSTMQSVSGPVTGLIQK